jgi:hypothetical protein
VDFHNANISFYGEFFFFGSAGTQQHLSLQNTREQAFNIFHIVLCKEFGNSLSLICHWKLVFNLQNKMRIKHFMLNYLCVAFFFPSRDNCESGEINE